MERIARQQHSADLLAMAAEALMIPEAWNLKQVRLPKSLHHLLVSRGMESKGRCCMLQGVSVLLVLLSFSKTTPQSAHAASLSIAL